MKLKNVLLSISLATVTIAVAVIAIFVPTTAQANYDTVYDGAQIAWNAGRATPDALAAGGAVQAVVPIGMGTLTVPTISSVKIKARGNDCGNMSPGPNFAKMKVSLNNFVLGTQTVTASYADYTYNVAAPASGTLKIEFINPDTVWFWFVLVACQKTLYVDTVTTTSGGSAPTTTTTTTTTTTSPTTPPPGSFSPGDEYVALGDSYGSGYGADRSPQSPTRSTIYYDAGADFNCGRSNVSAQRVLAARLNLHLINAACGGAATPNLTTTGQAGEPPQLDRLTTSTKLITAVIGGNDTALMYILLNCVVPNANCVADNTDGWWWSAASLIAQMYGKIDALQPAVENVIRQMVTRSPSAVIRLSGYPYVVAPGGEPARTCTWLSAGEESMFADAITRTNNKIRQAVQVVAAENPSRNIGFADPLAVGSPFMERDSGQTLDACSTSPQRYLNTNDGQEGYFHPNIDGQRRYADVFQNSLS